MAKQRSHQKMTACRGAWSESRVAPSGVAPRRSSCFSSWSVVCAAEWATARRRSAPAAWASPGSLLLHAGRWRKATKRRALSMTLSWPLHSKHLRGGRQFSFLRWCGWCLITLHWKRSCAPVGRARSADTSSL